MKKVFVEPATRQSQQNMQAKQLVDTDRAWEGLYRRLSADHLINEDTGQMNKQPVAQWIRLAASFLLLITTGFLVNYFLQKPDTTGLFTLISNNEQNTLVKVLPDGSLVYLAENASLQVQHEFSEMHRNVGLKGEAFFDIEHNPDMPFVISTGNASVQVIGTAFNIRSHHDQDFELFVEQGKVKIDLKKDNLQSMEARAGEMVSLERGKLTLKQDPLADAASWKINRMHFKDETLDNVISVINKNYGAHLFFEHNELKNRIITVTFFDNSLSKIIELLCLSMNLETEEKDDGTVLLRSKT